MKTIFTFLTLFVFCALSTIGQNHALHFDGMNDRVNCGNASSVQITGNQITLEAWIYATAWKVNVWQGNIINKELNGPNAGYMLRAGAGGSLNFNIGGGGPWNEITSNAVLSLNTWHHVAASYDGTYLRTYVDGVAKDSILASVSIANATGKDLTIGDWSSVGRHFEGMIDEVRVWNVHRTTAEINADMNSELCNQAGLVAYYKFNQGAAGGVNNSGVTTLFDATSNNNDGTLTNFALNGTTSNWDTSGSVINTTFAKAESPTLTVSKSNLCSGVEDSIVITVNGNLNDAENWYLYEISCGNNFVDTLPKKSSGQFVVKPSTTRFYYVRGEGECVDPGACAGVRTGVVSVPSLTFDITHEMVNNDGAIDLTVGASAPPHTYDWDTDGFGDNDDSEDLTGLTGGTYRVIVSDTNGCSIMDSAVVNPGIASGIEEKRSGALLIYPNPVSGGYIYIDAERNNYSLSEVKLINILGEVVKEISLEGKKTRVELDGLDSGIYLLNYMQGNSAYFERLVIK